MRARPLFLVLTAGLCLAFAARGENAPARPGRETCAACHDKEAEAFAASAHGRAIASRSKAKLETSCVACHGPAGAHVNDPSKANIVRVPAPAACLTCHAATGALLLTSPAHARNRVSCLDCHSA